MRDLVLLAYERASGLLRGHGLRRALPGVSRTHDALVRRLERGIELVHGRRMVLDPLDSLGIRSGPYEYFASQVLVPRLVRAGWSVADVGAHIGYYTLILAGHVGPAGQVYAFEPDRANFALLERNVRLNRLRNVVLERAAVTDRARRLTLYLAHENVADHRLFDFYKDRRSEPVRGIALDDRLSGRRVDLVKMDIQGAELAALTGMRAVLARNPGLVLLTEFAPRLLAQFGSEPLAYLRALSEHGFHLFDLDESARRLVPSDVASLDARYRAETEDYTNLLCLRGHLPAELREFV